MEIPKSQFYLFWVEEPKISHHSYILYQTYEEALQNACREAHSAEFIDLTPNNPNKIKLFFPKTNTTIIIHVALFTYDQKLPLAVPNHDNEEKTYDFKNLYI